MNSVPSLSTRNRYAPLSIDESNVTSPYDSTSSEPSATPTPTLTVIQPWIGKWERRLPKKYVLASDGSDNAIELNVVLETMDTKDTLSQKALLDSRTTGSFIDHTFMEKH